MTIGIADTWLTPKCLDKLRQGDSSAFGKMVESYSPPIYKLGMRMFGNSQDAEDVLQETFLKAYRGLPQFEGRSSLKTWLFRIAMNESLMRLRGKQNTEQSIDENEDGEEIVKPVDLQNWGSLPEKEFLRAEFQARMKDALEALSPALKSVFILRDIEGMSTAETAEMLEISEASVKTRLLRARLRLREELAGYFHEHKN